MNEEIAVSIKKAEGIIGLKKTSIYKLLNSGRIPAKKIGRKTLILKSDLDKFLEGLDAYPVNKGGIDDIT